MTPQRPRRPETRVPSPSRPAGKAPTSRQPAVRPATGAIHTTPTTRMPAESKTPTRSVSRRAAAPAPKKNNLPLILGIAGGGLLLIIVIAVAAAGGNRRAPAASNSQPATKKVDVTQLENDGMRKCEEGLVLIQRSYDKSDKAGLERGVALITEGNRLLDQANQMSGNTYDTKRFNEAFKMARNKILELK